LLLSGLIACANGPTGTIPPISAYAKTSGNKTMKPFSSDRELASYLRELAEKQRRESTRRKEAEGLVANQAPAAAAEKSADAKAEAKDEESITNTQHAGVDEGGIVKLHGNHLVVLRRGRLFTVAIGDGALRPISTINAFGPDIDPRYTWYDEMLVSGNTIAVIGYSYERGGTEVGLFNIDEQGQLAYRSTYHLRSNDYYSSRNYASRLIGSKLIFYTPLYLTLGAEDPFQTFPAVRKWHKGATSGEFRRIVSANHIYRPEADFNVDYGLALHTVTVCELGNGGFDCQATSVVGPAGRVFYVSPDAVYVWASSWAYRAQKPSSPSLLFRLPLDGSAPTALRTSAASPVDQFSFLQSEDQHLNVLVRADASGDGMWGAERAAGDVSLLRIPIANFSDGSDEVPANNYRRLPKPTGYTFQNRFVGDYLLYGTGSGWGDPENNEQANLFVVRWDRGDSHQLSLPHGVDRIEQMGDDAVVVGTDGKDLHFSAVKLGSWPEVAFRYTRKGASQGELRSHGFFYKPDGPDSGTIGLPISTPGRPGYRHLIEDSVSILFLHNDSSQFRELGELESQPEKAVNDRCRASCVDWYGNARPLFIRGRVFALLGYEIVEGRLDDRRMRELRRVNYAPGRQFTRQNSE